MASGDEGDEAVTGLPRTRSKTDSPLAKVFGHGLPPTRASGPKIGQAAKSTSRASQAEIDGLKTELTEVRASQLRMEEMMAKMLSGGGSGSGSGSGGQ